MKKSLILNALLVLLLAVTGSADCQAQHKQRERGHQPLSQAQIEAAANEAYKLIKVKKYKDAFPLLCKAANAGDCVSQGMLGTMYYEGKGVDVDFEKAREWWQKSVEGGCGDEIKKYLDKLDFIENGIHYVVKNDKSVTVLPLNVNGSNYSGLTTVVIPSNVSHDNQSYPVTIIGESAFAECHSLTSVTIPNSVTQICSSAFESCI